MPTGHSPALGKTLPRGGGLGWAPGGHLVWLQGGSGLRRTGWEGVTRDGVGPALKGDGEDL